MTSKVTLFSITILVLLQLFSSSGATQSLHYTTTWVSDDGGIKGDSPSSSPEVNRPTQFQTVLWEHYDAERDVLYIVGLTNAASGGKADLMLSRYDDWRMGGRNQRYIVDAPANLQQFAIAGDYIFAADAKAAVHVWDAASGVYVCMLEPPLTPVNNQGTVQRLSAVSDPVSDPGEKYTLVVTSDLWQQQLRYDWQAPQKLARIRVAGQGWVAKEGQSSKVVSVPLVVDRIPAVAVDMLPNQQVATGVRVQQATSLPGKALVEFLDSAGVVVQAVAVELTYDPPILDLIVGEPNAEGKSATLQHDSVPITLGINAADDIVTQTQITLAPLAEDDTVGAEKLLHSGNTLPPVITFDTMQVPDGRYQVRATVDTTYGSQATTTTLVVVRNWRELVDTLPPPMTGWFAIDLQATIEESPGWEHDTETPETFFGDKDRLRRVDDTAEYLIWEATAMKSFEFILFVQDEEAVQHVTLAVSTDQNTWQEIPFTTTVTDSAGSWQRLLLSGEFPLDAAVNYIKFSLNPGFAADALQLGQAKLVYRAENGL